MMMITNWWNIIRCISARSIKYNGFNFSNAGRFKHAGSAKFTLKTCKYANIQTCKHANIQTCKYANIQHANMQILKIAANDWTARLDTTGRQPTHGWACDGKMWKYSLENMDILVMLVKRGWSSITSIIHVFEPSYRVKIMFLSRLPGWEYP